jgi:hypothetical protein
MRSQDLRLVIPPPLAGCHNCAPFVWGESPSLLLLTREVPPRRGAMALASSSPSAGPGGPRRRWWPVPAIPRKGGFAGERQRGPEGPRPLGAAMDSSAFFTAAISTATTGARPSPTITAPAGPGPERSMIAPSRGPRKGCYAAKNAGSMIRALRGPEWSRLPTSQCRHSATTGYASCRRRYPHSR